MVTVLALLGVVGVLFAAAVLATREEALLADAPPDVADVSLPAGPLAPEDIGRLRFSLAPRGYRMSQVDQVLERLSAELADRDRRIAQLQEPAPGARAPGHAATAVPASAGLPTAADVVAATLTDDASAQDVTPEEKAPEDDGPDGSPSGGRELHATAESPTDPEVEVDPEAEVEVEGQPRPDVEPERDVEPESASDPFLQPTAPGPLPAPDAGSGPAAEEQSERDTPGTPRHRHDDTGSQAATSEVTPDTLLAALEESGERPHQP